MAYEYNAESQRLDFPNPFYMENWFLMLACAALLISSIALLMMSRGSLSGGHGVQGALPLILGVGLLLAGLRQGQRLMMQLRFFFGRSQPAGLAPELAPDAAGKSSHADELKETLRQNALPYPEPTGPLNGLLYAWIRDLIFAPLPVQYTAQRQFQNGIAIGVTLLSFLVSWVGFSDSRASGWMGLFYFAFSVFLLLRPLDAGARARTQVGMKGLVVLILVAIFGPVLLPMVAGGLPDIRWLSLEAQTCFLLVAALAGVLLFFRALMNQMSGPPATNMAREQLSLSINCHPKQLLDELDRVMQDGWVERIPNRRYARILPTVGGGAGTFSAELIEETQPMPAREQRRLDFAAAFSQHAYRWIAWLDVLGVVLVVLGAAWLVVFGARFDPALVQPSLFSLVTLGLAMLAVGSFCLRAGHALWGRFDFVSQLIWVEMQGNYQAARLDFGNTFTDRVKTERQVINIETMTLRVWAAELDSVIFDKRAPRKIIGLRGIPDVASRLATGLREFAREQSIIVAPTAQSDLQKSALLGAINTMGGQAGAASLPQAMQRAIEQANGPAAAASTSAGPACAACQADIEAGDRFCGSCGHPVGAPA